MHEFLFFPFSALEKFGESIANLYATLQASNVTYYRPEKPLKRVYHGAQPNFSESEKVDIQQMTALCNGTAHYFLYWGLEQSYINTYT